MSCLGVFGLILFISYVPLHHSRCQNCPLPLKSLKFHLCSRQTFHLFDLLLSVEYRTLCFVMLSIVYDIDHINNVIKVLRLTLHIKNSKKPRNLIHSNSNFLSKSRNLIVAKYGAWLFAKFCESKVFTGREVHIAKTLCQGSWVRGRTQQEWSVCYECASKQHNFANSVSCIDKKEK